MLQKACGLPGFAGPFDKGRYRKYRAPAKGQHLGPLLLLVVFEILDQGRGIRSPLRGERFGLSLDRGEALQAAGLSTYTIPVTAPDPFDLEPIRAAQTILIYLAALLFQDLLFGTDPPGELCSPL